MTKDVSLAGQVTASPAEEEKNTNPTNVEPNLHDEIVDLLGIDVMTQYYNMKLLYDKYCDNMLKRRKSSNIINCDVLTQKGPISQKVHREDGIKRVRVSAFKRQRERDLHLRREKSVAKLKIDFNKPLKEQDPLNELNDLAKKRKRTRDSTDHSKSAKKYKSSVQHEEEKLKRVVSLLEGLQDNKFEGDITIIVIQPPCYSKSKISRDQQEHFQKMKTSSQNQSDLPRDISLDIIEVLRNWVNAYAIRITKLLSGIEDRHHGPSDAMHNPL
ncbi:hypothetical protein Tco_0271872 [Tanacetum coccineum]